MNTHTHTTYNFNELSEEAQENAIKKLWDINVDGNEWYQFNFDDAKTIGALIGIEIKNIYFSGFSCQGDGACLEGYYSYAQRGLKTVKDYAPQDTELHEIAKNLQELQRKHFYRLSASVKHRGHYYHSLCTVINVEDENCYDYYASTEVTEELSQLLREFMDWIYHSLECEYDYLVSREAIKETIEANDYEFNQDGTLHH